MKKIKIYKYLIIALGICLTLIGTAALLYGSYVGIRLVFYDVLDMHFTGDLYKDSSFIYTGVLLVMYFVCGLGLIRLRRRFRKITLFVFSFDFVKVCIETIICYNKFNPNDRILMVVDLFVMGLIILFLTRKSVVDIFN